MTALPRTLRLSIAELDFIARACDLAAFPGLATDIADPASDGVILDGLRAHGIIEESDDELELREDVATLLAAILACDVSLELEMATADEALGIVVHLHEHVAILQHAHDGLVSLMVLRPGQVPAVLLSLCGEDPASADGGQEAADVRVSRDTLIAAELGRGEAAARLAGYVSSATAPARTGRAAARGTLYGEPRAACAWVAGAGGTFVLHDRGDETEIVRADGRRLAEQLLSIAGPAS